jgi:hypothetical protein
MRMRSSGLAALLTLLGGLLIAEVAEGQEELFAANFSGNSITVYHRTAGGSVVPVRTLGGPATGLSGPGAVILDAARDELIVANINNSSITVYHRTASGDTAPLRTLGGPATGLGFLCALALDFTNLEGGPGVGTLYVVNRDHNTVNVYLWPNAGNAAPLRQLVGPATGLDSPCGLALDHVNNELLVSNMGGTGDSHAVNVYSRTASGNTAPLRTLSGPATGLSGANALALDFTNLEGGPGVGTLYVVNQSDHSVTAYLWPNAGNAAPIRTLKGDATQLDVPLDIALDLANDELVVTNFRSSAVTVYSRTANGNTGPRRILRGAATGLNQPYGVAATARALAVDRDFNGDGTSDILWRHTSGALTMSLMKGASVVGAADLGTVPAIWTIVGSGDFNGDRRADLLFRHTSGTVAVVLMNGASVVGAADLGTMTAEWTIARVGDFNGDSKADILWRHASGAVTIWFTDGARVIATGSVGQIATDWQLQ